jgi:multisubunit Na+/H+ antiporter MnhB subunit
VDDLVSSRVSPDPAKEYENLTSHLRYLNDKIIEASLSFAKIATAIIGGTFYFAFSHYEKARNFWFPVDLLMVVVGCGHILIILRNLYSWHDYRTRLSTNFIVDRPRKVKWWHWEIEMIMCGLIVAVVVGFVYYNPLGTPYVICWCK